MSNDVNDAEVDELVRSIHRLFKAESTHVLNCVAALISVLCDGIEHLKSKYPDSDWEKVVALAMNLGLNKLESTKKSPIEHIH